MGAQRELEIVDDCMSNLEGLEDTGKVLEDQLLDLSKSTARQTASITRSTNASTSSGYIPTLRA